MGPSAILKAWERCWGRLDDELRARFLARPEVAELQRHGERVVLPAIGKHQKLHEILAEVRAQAYFNDERPRPKRGFGPMINRPGRPEDSRGR